MQLRKHYFLDEWVIVATDRAKRPHQMAGEDAHNQGTDFFAPGNEHLCPPEIGRISDGDGWRMRWFPNKFPAAQHEDKAGIETHNEYYTFGPSFGYHEVIVETPDQRQIWDLSAEELTTLLGVYKHRIEELGKKEGIKYVQVFKNHGAKAGTSIVHAHTQVVAQAIIPPIVDRKLEHPPFIYERLIEREKGSERACFENDAFVAWAPWASRFPLELWVMPRRFVCSMEELEDEELRDWAEILHQALGRLKTINAPFNIALHYAPPGTKMHLHMEILPRLATWAGYEHGTGIIINPVPPEHAAKFYRGEEEKD